LPLVIDKKEEEEEGIGIASDIYIVKAIGEG